MTGKLKILIVALTVAAIMVGVVATTVLAQTRGTVLTPTEGDYQAWGCPGYAGDSSAVAALLGMTTTEIDAQLQSGKSLVEIARGKNVSEDQLVAAMIAPMKDIMQKQVSDGSWTQAQLDARLKLADQHIRQLVNVKGGAIGSGGFGGCGLINGGGCGNFNNNTQTGFRGGMMGGLARTY